MIKVRMMFQGDWRQASLIMARTKLMHLNSRQAVAICLLALCSIAAVAHVEGELEEMRTTTAFTTATTVSRDRLEEAAAAAAAAAADDDEDDDDDDDDEQLEGQGQGQFVEPAEMIVTSEGEVAVDYAHGKRRLPEQLNDGELEGGDHHTSWSYSNQDTWDNEYPQCRGVNMRQSPVDIVTDKVTFVPRMKLEFVDYNQEVEFEFKNTHHSVSLTPISSIGAPSLRVNWIGKQEELYELQEIHFHWGDGLNKGSEHEINDQQAAAEMHMVHYRKGLDKSQIGSVENSVVVIGVLIESDALEHNKLEGLVLRTGHVNGTDQQYKDNNPENLINLLPDNRRSFYTYNGSLTTPPCYEVVTWVIMSEPVFMCQEKLAQLSNLEAEWPGGARKKIMSNHRDIQPLLDRPIYGSFNVSDTSTYKLSAEFHMKRIGQRNSSFARAMDEYWNRVNSLRVSVRRAYHLLDDARRRLLIRLGLLKPSTRPDLAGAHHH